MNTMSLKQRAYNYIQRHEGEWISGGEIEKLAQQTNYKSSNVSRRLRELASEGYIQRREMKKGRVHTVFYRYLSTALNN